MWRKDFSNFMGMLFGPIDLPVLSKSTVSDISYGAAADMKKECVLLLRR